MNNSSLNNPFLIESYQNGTSWYRVYSDGWCEQGGAYAGYSGGSVGTVNFLKPYKDLNYYVNHVYMGGYTGAWYGNYIAITNLQTSSFDAYVGNVGDFNRWAACGYIS